MSAAAEAASIRVRILACPVCAAGPHCDCSAAEGVVGWLGVHADRVAEALVRGSEVDERLLWAAESSRDADVLAAAARVRLDRANAGIAAVASSLGVAS